MNNTGQQGDKMSYRILLLVVVGLIAFSSAMKELNQFRQFTLDARNLIAEVSEKLAPAEPVQVVRLETCNSNMALQQSAPTIELPWLDVATEPSAVAPDQVQSQAIERPVLTHRSKPTKVQIAKLNKLRDLDPVHFEVRISPDNDTDEAIIPELPSSLLKAKSRKHGAVRINPRDREMLLKTLNRSFTFRIAS
jgi:hypothetical protein